MAVADVAVHTNLANERDDVVLERAGIGRYWSEHTEKSADYRHTGPFRHHVSRSRRVVMRREQPDDRAAVRRRLRGTPRGRGVGRLRPLRALTGSRRQI